MPMRPLRSNSQVPISNISRQRPRRQLSFGACAAQGLAHAHDALGISRARIGNMFRRRLRCRFFCGAFGAQVLAHAHEYLGI